MKSADSSMTPFASLTPDSLLDALESIGLRPDGRLLALNSYENRVYQVFMEEGAPLVVKFYRAGRWSDAAILEEHDFSRELAVRELPVVAAMAIAGQTLHRHGDLRFAVFPRQRGRAPEFDSRQTLEWMGRFIGRIHAVGALKPFAERPEINIHSFGEAPRDFLQRSGFLPPDLANVYFGVVDQALDGVRRCFERAGRVATLRLHGDCHAGNVLWVEGEGGGPFFVDFDDSRMGPAIQDLWMLLSGERADQVRQLADVLAGYEDFFAFDSRELYLIEALRTLRLIHYAGWLARRWDDPAFPAAFPWFNTQRYWQDRILELREQIALMDEPPLWSA
ncbi:MAG: serine/threonine protein kinase [Propionivibrio sp.]|uniref:Stress response kinase A n=1 Tax=Candidatus Propionivibrio dominans TaxID=2954373 RepID=A0A9D7F799_9RHOO|nr:serine/threonine protein kinase [Candidatus Propionivibrio dominans]MBL0168684.1 serine/threonine protein kinase [Propionivibrio sp.]